MKLASHIGINDIAGTGLYSSEYIVGSYGINKTDFHFGLGWGQLNGSSESFRNPLEASIKFLWSENTEGEGGQFQPSRYFPGEKFTFFGITHAINEKYILKFEYDTTLSWVGRIWVSWSRFSFGIDFGNENLTFGISAEGNSTSIKVSYKNNSNKLGLIIDIRT